MAAASSGSLECVRLLLEAKCDPNKADEDGDNALCSAYGFIGGYKAKHGKLPDPALSCVLVAELEAAMLKKPPPGGYCAASKEAPPKAKVEAGAKVARRRPRHGSDFAALEESSTTYVCRSIFRADGHPRSIEGARRRPWASGWRPDMFAVVREVFLEIEASQTSFSGRPVKMELPI
eukprot:7381759-Prymnesium_polylepis.1